MSFSSEVKEELSGQINRSRHCQIAEISAVISLCGKIQISSRDRYCIRVQTENAAVAKKYYQLLRKAFQVSAEITIRQNQGIQRQRTYFLTVAGHDDSIRILQAVRLINTTGDIVENLDVVDNIVIQQSCCKRAYIRGAFLATGSISDPAKFYHFEIVCTMPEKAEQLQKIIGSFQIEAKIIQRKKYYVVYIKEGAMIVDILNVMEAHVALMNLENIRILKEMRNSVNRKVNCETANLSKTVSAAVRQIEDIQYIEQRVGLHVLTDGLEEVARLRLENSDVSLKELGMMLNPPVGKSGVNHRLRKICNYANDLKGKEGGSVTWSRSR